MRAKKIEDAFPITMYENKRGWKLMARRPNRLKALDQFEFIIDDKDFLTLDFIPLIEESDKVLRGTIILNQSDFLAEGESFDWNSETAENRIVKKLAEEQKIDNITLKDIDCSSSIL